MADREVTLPEPSAEDDEDVVWGLSTARTLWARGERADAVVWLRRAADAATAAGQDFRASQLGICATELEDAIAAGATTPAETPAETEVEPETEVDVERDLTPPATPAAPAPKPQSSAPPSAAPAAPRARPMSPWAQTLASPPSIPTSAAPAPSVVVQAPPPVAPAPPPPVAAFEAPAPPPTAPVATPAQPPSASPPASAAVKAPQSTAAPVPPPPPLSAPSARPKPKPRAPILDPWTVDPPSSASPTSTAAEDPPSAARRPPPPPPIGGSGGFVEVRTRPSSDDDDVVTSAAPLETTLGRKPRPPAPPPPPPPTRKPADVAPVSTPRPEAPAAPPAPPAQPPAPAASAPPPPSAAVPPSPVAPASARAPEGPGALGEARVAVPSKRPLDAPAAKGDALAAAAPAEPPPAPAQGAPAPKDEAAPPKMESAPPAVAEPAAATTSVNEASADAPALRSLAGVSLEDVPALVDLPEDMQEGLVASARIAELAVDEELSGFGAALVLDGSAFVCATIVDVAAMTAEPRAVIAPRGSLADPIALRIVAGATGTRLAVWEASVFDAALDPCPWVRDEIREAADRIQALAGATMGPLGELDDPTREGTLARLEARVLEPGEVLVAHGGAALGVVLVGVGTLELADDAGATTQTLKSGELLFPGSALDGSAAPATARAGQGGAIVLTSDRKTAGALFAEFPSLLELFSS